MAVARTKGGQDGGKAAPGGAPTHTTVTSPAGSDGQQARGADRRGRLETSPSLGPAHRLKGRPQPGSGQRLQPLG